MLEASASVLIKQPIEIVWDYTTTPENIPAYLAGVVEMTPLSDNAVSVGAQWKGKNSILGRTFEWRGEFTRVDTHKDTEFQTIEAAFPFKTHSNLEETSDGVRMTYHVESANGFGGVFGKMADPIVMRIYQRSLTASIESIPDLIEEWLARKG
ncbi:SRPBCC family protein [Gordonia westfalica]|uniref:Polyketide cyclase / dehydrase and lipid transport n=1 Tax=Gordonia westfalica TaxID=158898 RepID=A0A1H2LTH8_9ACTN|nr:SRPBCC family protein [Gordonia westfalica]MDS1113903.1 SRPBCC family protein [Gordonia westfalica]SDU84162.1 Polyketide cyclase / dehydrase and lipid transport [Gordonia westfalica]